MRVAKVASPNVYCKTLHLQESAISQWLRNVILKHKRAYTQRRRAVGFLESNTNELVSRCIQRRFQGSWTMHLSGYVLVLLIGSFWLVSSLQPLYRSPHSTRHPGCYLVHIRAGASGEELVQQLRGGNEDEGDPEFEAHLLSLLKSAANGFVVKLSPKALNVVSCRSRMDPCICCLHSTTA